MNCSRGERQDKTYTQVDMYILSRMLQDEDPDQRYRDLPVEHRIACTMHFFVRML